MLRSHEPRVYFCGEAVTKSLTSHSLFVLCFVRGEVKKIWQNMSYGANRASEGVSDEHRTQAQDNSASRHTDNQGWF